MVIEESRSMKEIKMNRLEREFEAAIESKDLPGAVLTASNASGKFVLFVARGYKYQLTRKT